MEDTRAWGTFWHVGHSELEAPGRVGGGAQQAAVLTSGSWGEGLALHQDPSFISMRTVLSL